MFYSLQNYCKASRRLASIRYPVNVCWINKWIINKDNGPRRLTTFHWVCFPAFHARSPEPFDPRFQAFSGSVVVNSPLWHPPRSHSSPACGSTETTMRSMWNRPAFKWNQGEKVVCQTWKTDVSYFSVSNWSLTLVKFKFHFCLVRWNFLLLCEDLGALSKGWLVLMSVISHTYLFPLK